MMLGRLCEEEGRGGGALATVGLGGGEGDRDGDKGGGEGTRKAEVLSRSIQVWKEADRGIPLKMFL